MPGSSVEQSGLRVRFFGNFEVFSQGGALELGRNNKAIAIFKYLLAHRSRPVSQERLMGWLWPESNTRKARWSLNSAVYALRKTLDRVPSPIISSDYVVLERGHYHLDPDVQVSSDVEEFDARYESGRLLQRSRQVQEAVPEYEKAVELHRDDYLIEDLYEDWTMIERERLSSACVDMLDRLADYYAETGQLHLGIRSRYQLLEKDPYHEESYRSLMRCYDRLGLRGRALRQYELCERALRNLYGMSPAPETRNLYETLRGSRNI